MGEGLGANPAHWVIHDLRRTMVTKMAEDLEIDPIIFDHQSGEERSNLAVRFGPG
jgi:hypothetical protein